jgi:hypothetical protein
MPRVEMAKMVETVEMVGVTRRVTSKRLLS